MSENRTYPELPASHPKNMYSQEPIGEKLFGEISARFTHEHALRKIGNPVLRREILERTEQALKGK